MKADSVCAATIACRVENLFSAGNVGRILRDVRLVRPMIWRQDAARDTRLSMKQITDERIAVGGKCEGLPDFAVSEKRVFQVDAEVREIRSWALSHGKLRPTDKHGDEIGGKGTHFEIGRAFAEFEGADDGVGNDAKTNVFD